MTRIRTLASPGTCVVGCLGLFAVAYLAPAPAPPEGPPAERLSDAHGDPLPAGAVARVGTRRFQQEERLASFSFSPDGAVVAVGGDRVIRLFDALTGKELRTFGPHQMPVEAVRFMPDGKALASASFYDCRLSLWDPETGTEIRRLARADAEVAGPLGRRIQVGVAGLAVAPRGGLLAAGYRDGVVCLWDVATGKEVRRWRAGREAVRSLGFSADTRRLALGADFAASVRDVATGEEVRAVAGCNVGSAVALSPDGKRLAAACSDPQGAVFVWDADTGKLLRLLTGLKQEVRSLAFAPDGGRLAAEDQHTVLIWDAATGERGRRWRLPGGAFPGTTEGPVGFSPDGKEIACGTHRTLCFWDLATGEQKRAYARHRGPVSRVAFTPDGRGLLTGSQDGTAALWDLVTGRQRRLFGADGDGAFSPALSSDGRRLVALDRELALRAWDAATGEALPQFEDHHSHAGAVALSPGGDLLATLDGKGGGTARLWDVATGKVVRSVQVAPPGAADRRVPARALAFAAGGKALVCWGDGEGARRWDVATGREVPQPAGPRGPARSAPVFSADGRVLAFAGGPAVRVQDVESGEEVRRVETGGGPPPSRWRCPRTAAAWPW